MRIAGKICQILKDHVDAVFVVPGGGAMHLNDALGQSGLKVISMTSEGGAGFAAIGYAMAHGFAVCLVTSGPGALNAVAPCGAAWMDSVPVLFISGQCKTADLIGNSGLRTRGNQEINITKIIPDIVKLGFRPRRNQHWVNEVLPELIEMCQSTRPGPCWLDIPMDIQAEEIE